MNRQRLFRGLRIAWTAGFGILCLLLIALWVRSYWWVDSVRFPISRSSNLGGWSVEGTIAVIKGTHDPGFFNVPGRMVRHHVVNRRVLDNRPQIRRGNHGPFGFGVMAGNIPYAPHWFFVFVLSVLAILPWIRRFSLRTLLIATTLVAVVLGVIVAVR
jgi:hypothetical protein